MKVVPDPEAVTQVLQKRKVTGNIKAFLQLAHEQKDQMWSGFYFLSFFLGKIVSNLFSDLKHNSVS